MELAKWKGNNKLSHVKVCNQNDQTIYALGKDFFEKASSNLWTYAEVQSNQHCFYVFKIHFSLAQNHIFNWLDVKMSTDFEPGFWFEKKKEKTREIPKYTSYKTS